jgi:alkyl sulfatase BDS1-like metallo-beta-lactamase superfamily hydrolase
MRGSGADITVRVDRETFADVVSGRATLAEAIDAGSAALEGDREVALRALGCFDHPAFVSPPSHG